MAGAAFGWFNGVLVEVARIDSFIATLGTGTVIYARGPLVHGRPADDRRPAARRSSCVNSGSISACPITAFYVLVIALLLWIVTEYLPIGRYLYAIGANPRAAELNGIPTRRYVIGAFMASGAITAFAGVVLAARLRIGQASVGLDFLLPALVGAFLGSTTIKPGRVNVWGTIVGVVILAVGISGIQQFGGAFWVEPMFNGVTLLIAIGFAGWTGRRRGRAIVRVQPIRRVHAARLAGRQPQGELNDASDYPASLMTQRAGARRRRAHGLGRRLPRPGQGHGEGCDRERRQLGRPDQRPGRHAGQERGHRRRRPAQWRPHRRRQRRRGGGQGARLDHARHRRPGHRRGRHPRP